MLDSIIVFIHFCDYPSNPCHQDKNDKSITDIMILSHKNFHSGLLRSH